VQVVQQLQHKATSAETVRPREQGTYFPQAAGVLAHITVSLP
jgi:hypothetical protein